MKKRFLSILCLLSFTQVFSLDAEEIIFDFLAEEAEVVTASRQPTSLKNAPATIYIVTAEDIAASGGNTIWDALRGLPGVDVMTTRTWQSEVSLRGLNRPLNNRVLVLLDGKTVLNGFFDFVTWETIPVILEDIDRIEVVLGPASALYGANAIHGVINIITKTPSQHRGFQTGYAIGEYRTQIAHAIYGQTTGAQAFKLSGTWRQGNAFEDPNMQSSQVFKTHGLWQHEWRTHTHVTLSGGFAHHKTQTITSGAAGRAFDDGQNGFLKFTAQYQNTHFQTFWNRGRITLSGFDNFNDPNIDYDTFDFSLEHHLNLPGHNQMTLGVHFRRNNMQSKVFGNSQIDQNLWAGFFENVWSPNKHMDVTLSGRLDRHPLAGTVFSPRGSLTLKPHPKHTFRATTATAFRYPTLTENYLDFIDRIENDGALAPNPPIQFFVLDFAGNPNLKSENMLFYEGAYTGQFGPIRSTVTGFHYRLRDLITTGLENITFVPPNINVQSTFTNTGSVKAWGGEVGAEVQVTPHLQGYANYAFQDFSDEFSEEFTATEGGPRHKVNGGFRIKKEGWLFNTSAHWVDGTSWDESPLPDTEEIKLRDFYLINTHLSYAFQGTWSGLKVGINAFNLTNHKHAQILPEQPNGTPGQSGEVLGRRLMINLIYRY